MVRQGKGAVVEGEATGGDVTVVATGATGLDAMVPAMADVIGTAAPELAPRLPISVDARGIPVLATPPETTGAVDVGVDIGVAINRRAQARVQTLRSKRAGATASGKNGPGHSISSGCCTTAFSALTA